MSDHDTAGRRPGDLAGGRPGHRLDATALDGLSFRADGLIPVIAQDRASGAVLMLAWANREALERTLETGDMHFWSRSRQELWRKGDTSGNVLTDAELRADCDGDTVLARVTPTGPACHTGASTCFGETSAGAAESETGTGRAARADADIPPRSDIMARLADVLRARAREKPADSYTVRLLGDPNLRVKKLGEESAELVAALAADDPRAVVEEAADLVYHLMVAVVGAGRHWADVEAELERRAGG